MKFLKITGETLHEGYRLVFAASPRYSQGRRDCELAEELESIPDAHRGQSSFRQ